MNTQQQSFHLDPGVSARLAGFTRFARANSFNLGLQESLDAQQLAAATDISDQRQLRLSLKTLLCSSVTEWGRFDSLFDAYFQSHKPTRQSQSTIGGLAPRQQKLAEASPAGEQGEFDVPDASALTGSAADAGGLSHAGASAIESLSSKNFDQLANPEELRRMEDLAERLAQRIRHRLLRRQRAQQKGRQLDMRRSIRASLRYGGLPLSLCYRQRRRQVPKLVLLLDVSRSMSVYSHLFLRFARGILGAFKGADAFAFHTRLIHIGETLREPSRRKLGEKMALVSAGWDGGTRIDKALTSFNRDYAHNVLNSRSVVIVVSDGYDTGEPEVLAAQLQRIKRRARRLLWLNPLLGLDNYTPSTASMQAALPFIDIFAPAHNLQSLAALESHLQGL